MKNNSSLEDYRIRNCRICKSNDLYFFLSLGSMPIPNGFLEEKNLLKKEEFYPLGVCVCKRCFLVQLTHVIPAKIMFKNYLYIPSTSVTMVDHFRSLAKNVAEKYKLDQDDLVVDIGSNDGTLLTFFKEQEVKTLGIDPASNLAKVAQLKGIDTIDDFFSRKLACKIKKQKGKAKIITATNVIAHIDNLDQLFQGVKELLDRKGIFITEFPYLPDLIKNNQFDTIYHEHLSYFSLTPFNYLVKKHGMKIIDIEKIKIHGGSIRIYMTQEENNSIATNAVKTYFESEMKDKINNLDYYKNFAKRVRLIKTGLIKYLRQLKKKNKRIIGYGAAAKGNVLLNYCQIKNNLLDYIVDSIPFKQGRYTPGTHIVIHPESRLQKEMPDYVLLLAWNFADEILKKQANYREKGGKFIITIPYLRIE